VSRAGAVIEGRSLRVIRGGSVIVDVPSLTVEEGEVLSLIGPNGAGKTTLLQTVSYLTKPFEGDLFFRGRKVGPECPVLTYRRAIAMVFQEPLLFDATVFENVASGLKIRGMKRVPIRQAVAESLSRFGISHLSDRSARSLSGGEAQRTSLARAFAIRPDILLLDEPFASLDPRSREPLIEDIQAVVRSTGTTAVFVTHDLMESVRLSDRIAVMDRGRILQAGPPEEVLNAPVDEFVASFVGVGTILKGRVKKSGRDTVTVSVSDREVESACFFPVGSHVILCIRPENVTLSVQDGTIREDGGPVTSARNVFPGTVTRVTPMGFYQKVGLDCGFPLVSYVTMQSRELLKLAEGRRVTVSFKATAVHVIRKD
jgi:tungstate transport system ATP-binding protein